MPRRTVRQFPAVIQSGVPTGVTINDSRVVFSGQRGLAVVGWGTLLTVTNSVARLFVGVEIIGTALLGLPLQGATSPVLDANGDEFLGWTWAVVQDPSEGSFLELQTRQNTSVVVIPANGSQLIVLSYAPEVGAGPVADVS